MELAYKLWGQAESPQKVISVARNGRNRRFMAARSAHHSKSHFTFSLGIEEGHGKSQIQRTPSAKKNATYTPLDYGQDLVDAMASLTFHPAWVVGHSMGVRSACALAHLKPDWVCGLVLVDLGFSGAAGGGLGDGLAGFSPNFPSASRPARPPVTS